MRALLVTLLSVSLVIASPSASLESELEGLLKGHDKLKTVRAADPSGFPGLVVPPVADTAAAVEETAPTIPDAYIVRLAKGARLPSRNVHDDIHARFHKRASEDISYSTRYEFKDPSLFFGVSIQVDDGSTAEDIEALPEVERVWPVRVIERPSAINLPPIGSYDDGEFTANYTATSSSKARVNEPHVMSDVDRVHEKGIKGKNVKVVVIDTGVDYRHPALGGCFGKGCRISFGHDFVGDNYWQNGIPVEDADPLATCESGGHGTHVTGIIGAVDTEESPFGLVGVAPEAELGVYRVFSCRGGAVADVLMKALERSAEDDVDVVNLSAGFGMYYAEENPFNELASNLAAKGIALVMSAGNDGRPGVVSAPAVSDDVISVGSVENTRFPTIFTGRTSSGRTFKYSGSPWPMNAPAGGLKAYDLVKLASGTSSPHGCSVSAYRAAAAAVADLGNAILLVPKTEDCSQGAKWNAAAAYGFKFVLLYATDRIRTHFDDDYYTVSNPGLYQMATVSKYDGETIMSGFGSAKAEYRLYFDSDIIESPRQGMGGLMSNFSSMGPSMDTLVQKPQVSGPGGNILSTWPLSATGYAILSGTSMASPFVAGVVALLKQKFPAASLGEIRSRLQSTARPFRYYTDVSLYATTGLQGTGLVNAYDALFFESVVTPSELRLGDASELRPRTITIENKSARTKTYKVAHEPAGLQYLVNAPWNMTSNSWPNSRPLNYPEYAAVSFSATTLTIPGGKSASFEATFAPPGGSRVDYVPVYSGYITVTNNNDKFVVSYLGLPYSRRDAQIIDTGDMTGPELPLLSYGGTNYTAIRDLAAFNMSFADMAREGWPTLNFRQLQITQHVRIDMVPYNTTFVPDHYGFSPSASNPHGVPASALPMVYPDMPLAGDRVGLETYGITGQWDGNWLPELWYWTIQPAVADSETEVLRPLVKGDYRPVLRVLKYGGDPTRKEDFETWLGAVIRVKRDLTLEEYGIPSR